MFPLAILQVHQSSHEIAPLCDILSGCRFFVSLWGPGQSPVRPFACCVGSLHSVSRCGRCSFCGVVATVAGPSSWRTGGWCWCLRGSLCGFGCPLPSAFWSSTTCLAVLPWTCGHVLFLHGVLDSPPKSPWRCVCGGGGEGVKALRCCCSPGSRRRHSTSRHSRRSTKAAAWAHGLFCSIGGGASSPTHEGPHGQSAHPTSGPLPSPITGQLERICMGHPGL